MSDVSHPIDKAPIHYNNEQAHAWIEGVEHALRMQAQEVAALRAERDHYIEQARLNWLIAEHMRPVVEAAVRRRIAWLKDDDDAENIAADRAEDAAVDAYRAASSRQEDNA